MSAEYELVLLDQRGRQITHQITAFESLEYARKLNDVGSLNLILSAQFPLSWFQKDNRIEIWRSVDNNPAQLEGETQWLVRKTVLSRKGGQRILKVTAQDLNCLLKRRIVAYDEATVYTLKTDYGDDMMKEIMSENFGLGCIDGDRDIHDWIDIQPDFGLAWPIDKAFARRELLPVFQELCQESTQNGYPLFFDMVRVRPNLVLFRTFLNQRGTDHSKGSLNPIIFSAQAGNLADDEYEFDATDESTFVYAGGKGEEAARWIGTAQDDDRIGMSPFGRIEYFVDARQADSVALCEAEAEATLHSRVPKKRITGKVVDTEKCVYGLHFHFGDKVTVETEEVSATAFINATNISVSEGKQTVNVSLEAEW